MGRTPIAYACYCIDDAIRIQSSSGGMFYTLAKNIIDKGGVVFGAAFDKDWNVRHIYIDSIDDLFLLTGSKYVQSDIGDSYKKVGYFLKTGKIVLFCGTPCQTTALRRYLNKEYANLYIIDFVCHGVASQKVWEEYLREVSKGLQIDSISFRDKTNGWNNFSIRISFKDGTQYLKSPYVDSFMKAYLKDIIQRPSCYRCQFKGLERASDITLADFWGVKNIVPEMYDPKGVSLVFLNSLKAFNLFKEISDRIKFKKIDIEQVVKFNENLFESIHIPASRKSFFIKYRNEKSVRNSLREVTMDSIIERVWRLVKRLVHTLIHSVVTRKGGK